YLILTHRRPDGDTVGSAGALAQGLRDIGKTAYVLQNPEITQRYSKYIADLIAPEDFAHEHVILVDTASPTLFPKDSEKYTQSVSLSIDHHQSNTMYAELTCLDHEFAACGELIYEILMELSGKISPKSAECIYVAITTDTGCFSYANTTANTLSVAAQVVKAGAPHVKINRALFRTKTRARIKVEGMINAGLDFYFGGKVAISAITGEMLQAAGANEDDIDDISNIPGSVQGVQCGITLRELSSPLDCKASIRTSPNIDANAIASHFGGGGHKMAAGFSQDKPISEVKAELVEVLKEFFPAEV
ncbi:MAG: bifunctional oligoribonuclease/PAP phosphatase NrnA, partial [Oscillospiraceae bacterium]|nr:bifunctional oligoribonuclease/PAP phosphatase NrnA [Oscillospiraceae bacterium]